MTTSRHIAALALFSFGFSAAVQASMVGDVLTIERLYPDLNTHFQPSVSTTVAVGPSDAINPFGLESVNPEADSISIHWTGSSSYIGTSSVFDGYRFTGFSKPIQNVTVTDVNNITVAALGFGNDFITLNFGSYFDSSSSLNLQIQFAPVSLPGSLPLLLSGVVGMFAFARKHRKGQ